MELEVLATRGINAGCVLSISAGGMRRHVQVSALDKPIKFPDVENLAQVKVDVLDVLGRARVPYQASEQRYTVPLDMDLGASASAETLGGYIGGKCDEKMEVDIIMRPCGPSSPSSPSKETDAERRIRKEMQANGYLEEHGLVNFMQFLLHSLMQDKPSDPLIFLQKQVSMQINAKIQGGSNIDLAIPSLPNTAELPGASNIDTAIPSLPNTAELPRASNIETVVLNLPDNAKLPGQSNIDAAIPSSPNTAALTILPSGTTSTRPDSRQCTTSTRPDSRQTLEVTTILGRLTPAAASSFTPEEIAKLESEALEAAKRIRADNAKLMETARQMKEEYEKLMSESQTLHGRLDAKRAKRALDTSQQSIPALEATQRESSAEAEAKEIRRRLVQDLQSLEAAKAALPAGELFAAMHAQIDAQIREQKRLINKSSPPGAVFDEELYKTAWDNSGADPKKVAATLGLTPVPENYEEFVTFCRARAQAGDGFDERMYKTAWDNSGADAQKIAETLGLTAVPKDYDEFVSLCRARAQAGDGFDERVYQAAWDSSAADPKKVAETLGLTPIPKDYDEFISFCQTRSLASDGFDEQMYKSAWDNTSADAKMVAESLGLTPVPENYDEFVTFCKARAQAGDGFDERMYKTAWDNSGADAQKIAETLGLTAVPKDYDEFVSLCKARAQAGDGFDERVYKAAWDSSAADPKKVAETLGLTPVPKDYDEFVSFCKARAQVASGTAASEAASREARAKQLKADIAGIEAMPESLDYLFEAKGGRAKVLADLQQQLSATCAPAAGSRDAMAQVAYTEISQLHGELAELAQQNAKLVSDLMRGREVLDKVKQEMLEIRRSLGE